jgi:secretion/DNA translocation related TadE-like protein
VDLKRASIKQHLCAEKGSVTILVTCVVLALLSMVVVIAPLSQIFIQQRITESAADLAAVAGAQNLIDGAQAACAHAGRVARLNATELVHCTSDQSSVYVVVAQEVQSARLHQIIPAVTATAKAGY